MFTDDCWNNNKVLKSRVKEIKHFRIEKHLLTINPDFSLNKLLICCLLIVNKVVVKLGVG